MLLMTVVIGVLYWVALDNQLTAAKLSIESDTRTNVGFQPLIRPDTIVLTVCSGALIQSVLLYPQKKMSSMLTPRPTQTGPPPFPSETCTLLPLVNSQPAGRLAVEPP